jgi:hypothetical protein
MQMQSEDDVTSQQGGDDAFMVDEQTDEAPEPRRRTRSRSLRSPTRTAAPPARPAAAGRRKRNRIEEEKVEEERAVEEKEVEEEGMSLI